MSRFMFHGSYSVDGVKGLVKEGGTGRRAAVQAALKTLGGKLESMYYAFGDTDVYVVVDGIDDVTAAAFSLGVGATGGFTHVKTTVLLTPEEIDQAGKKAISYRGPGH